MEIKDKRLIQRMGPEEQEMYLRNVSKLLTDTQDKYEECKITHEPIQLLKKIKEKREAKKALEQHSETITDKTQQEESP